MTQKIELLYIWIKKDSKNCFVNQGFNFSPSFSISYKDEEKTIIITDKRDCSYNIFKRDNILNISAIVGKNGSGKTTLLDYVTSLSSTGLVNINGNKEEYKEHEKREKLEKTYITVYLVDDKLKIINHTDSKIKYNNTSIPKYDVNADQEQIEQSISRIFISNSEYSANSNLRDCGRVNYITLTNNALQSIGKEFYEHISGEYTLHSVSGKIKDYFQEIQDVIINYKRENQNNGQKLQSILDVIFYSRVHKSNKKFLGKDVKLVKVGVLNLIILLKDYYRKAKENDGFAEYINKFTTYFDKKRIADKENNINILKKNYIVESCVVNAFSFDNFNGLDLDSAYKLCFEKNKGNNKYYEVAKQEVDGFLNMLSEENFCHNLLPANDLAYTEWFEIEIDKMGEFFENIYKNQDGLSFISKYLVLCDDGFRGVESLKMSSGERALLNIFSRIELCDFLSRIQRNDFNLNNNIMLLLDELDLYLHPEWQRNMITKIIDELKKIYPDKNIQIIFSTHSPLMLSDIPKSSILWLKPDEKEVNLDNQTFGANIYDLYKNDFFLNSFMGEFAKSEIDKLIKEIYVLYKEVLEYKIEKLNGNNDRCGQIKLKMHLIDKNIKDMEWRIALIGDKIIQHKLCEMMEEIEGLLNTDDKNRISRKK